MKVTIRGHSLSEFVVSVEDDSGQTEEFRIDQMLVVDDQNLEAEVSNAAATEHFWAQIALDAKNDLEMFKNIQFAQYEAHLDKYARYYLKAVGEKPLTNTAKERAGVLLFSRDVNQDECAKIAYAGYLDDCKKVGVTPLSLLDFQEEMYIYDISYEDAQTKILSMEYHYNRLQKIADAMNNKSWTIKSKAANERVMRSVM